MKTLRFNLLFIILNIFIYSCKQHAEDKNNSDILPKTPVKITHVSRGIVNDELTLFGTSFYLKRNIVTSPIPAFIIQVNIKLGDKVNKGDVLYVLQSKESRALGIDANKIDTSFKNFGIIQVKAPATGIITTLDKQQSGDYVLEGTQLCTIAESNDLVFQINVPYEYAHYTQPGKHCVILLPDNSRHFAKFIRALSSMNILSQTQPYLAKPNDELYLPENMIVKALINKHSDKEQQLLPKSCVLSDEMMTQYWIMKLINDSTAIKVPVVIGNSNNNYIEILSPPLNPADQIISEGNYGLADTAYVFVQK